MATHNLYRTTCVIMFLATLSPVVDVIWITCEDNAYLANNFTCTKRCHCADGSQCHIMYGYCVSGHCERGWGGKGCLESCRLGYFGKYCRQQCHCRVTPCDKTTGECPSGGCAPGWTSSRCDLSCLPGRYGPNCWGVCSCHEGYVCDAEMGCRKPCPARLSGPDCNQQCDDKKYLKRGKCEGICRCLNNKLCRVRNGSCVDGLCAKGWHGKACSTKCRPGTYGLYCAEKCNCRRKSVCEHQTGFCKNGCAPGYTGFSCNGHTSPSAKKTKVWEVAIWIMASIVVLMLIVAGVVGCERAFRCVSRPKPNIHNIQSTSGAAPPAYRPPSGSRTGINTQNLFATHTSNERRNTRNDSHREREQSIQSGGRILPPDYAEFQQILSVARENYTNDGTTADTVSGRSNGYIQRREGDTEDVSSMASVSDFALNAESRCDDWDSYTTRSDVHNQSRQQEGKEVNGDIEREAPQRDCDTGPSRSVTIRSRRSEDRSRSIRLIDDGRRASQPLSRVDRAAVDRRRSQGNETRRASRLSESRNNEHHTRSLSERTVRSVVNRQRDRADESVITRQRERANQSLDYGQRARANRPHERTHETVDDRQVSQLGRTNTSVVYRIDRRGDSTPTQHR